LSSSSSSSSAPPSSSSSSSPPPASSGSSGSDSQWAGGEDGQNDENGDENDENDDADDSETVEAKEDEEAEEEEEGEGEDSDEVTARDIAENPPTTTAGTSTHIPPSRPSGKPGYARVLYAHPNSASSSSPSSSQQPFNRQWPDDIHALRSTPYNATAQSTVPHITPLPLVPVSTRPGLPGSIFRWQLDLDNSYIRRVLETQIQTKSPYIGLFLYRKAGDAGVTLKKPEVREREKRGKKSSKAAAEEKVEEEGVDIDKLHSKLTSSTVKSSASSGSTSTTTPPLSDYDEVNKVHPFGVLAEFRLNGDSVTIICHRRIEIQGLAATQPNIIMVDVRHHEEMGPATASSDAAETTSTAPTTDTEAETPSAPSATTDSPTAAAPVYSKEVQTLVALINDKVSQLLTHDEIKKRSKAFTTPYIDTTVPGHLCDYVTSLLTSDADTLQDVLATVDLVARCSKVVKLAAREVHTMETRKRIQERVAVDMGNEHSQAWLKEQKRQIERTLGGREGRQALIDKFLGRLENKVVPPEVQRVLTEEMEKLANADHEGGEYNITRNYVDWLTSMPYGKYSVDNYDIERAEKVLNDDHYGMDEVKQRILEFIATSARAGKEAQQGRILCLTGPPGTGKTSIAKSIARALGREYVRFSVGGMDDVAEIKGHRRTYLGSLPGKLISALKTSGTTNPVILIDEVDKVGKGARGDPAAALLEVLDPEQNRTFVDNYMDVPIDLSHVLFLCTANDASLIPGPLADRMEFVNISGYVWKEKENIIRQYIEPAVKRLTGVKEGQVRVTDEAVEDLVRWYCREAGMRRLQRLVEQMYKKAALQMVRAASAVQSSVPLPMFAESSEIVIGRDNLKQYAGPPLYTRDTLYDENPVGVVTGLAWTSRGGSLIYVEAALADQEVKEPEEKKRRGVKEVNEDEDDDSTASTPSRGSLIITGQLGDVMKESVSIAYTVAKHQLAMLAPASNFFNQHRIHLHLPSGSTPKDGPSAGITITLAFLSLALNRAILPNFAFTGELSLTGRVLPVGGMKEKFLACRRGGVKVVVVAEENRKDVEELADFIRDGIEVRYAVKVEEVIEWGLGVRQCEAGGEQCVEMRSIDEEVEGEVDKRKDRSGSTGGKKKERKRGPKGKGPEAPIKDPPPPTAPDAQPEPVILKRQSE